MQPRSERSVCVACGFRPPSRAETAEALRALPSAWQAAMAVRPGLVEQAAFLRDEIHAVTNRVARVLAVPGSRLSSVTILVPTALASYEASPGVIAELLRMAVDRLAGLVEPLRSAEWHLSGRVGEGTVTVLQLVHVPLHHGHRDLTGVNDVGAAVVVPLDRRQRSPAWVITGGGVA